MTMTLGKTKRRVAMDGPAASGKSAVGGAVARLMGLPFIDTGAIYRALTWFALLRGIHPDDGAALTNLASSVTIALGADGDSAPIRVDGLDATPFLRSREVEQHVSTVSAVPGVREHLIEIQRRLANHSAVMAGRDIGSVVLPDAELKIFLDASPEERAYRRLAQLHAQGEQADFDGLVQELRRRDHLDSTRPVSPLRAAPDAVRIDTDGQGLDEVIAGVLALARTRFDSAGSAGPLREKREHVP